MNGLKDLIAANVAYSSRLRMAKIIAATVHISLLANILKKNNLNKQYHDKRIIQKKDMTQKKIDNFPSNKIKVKISNSGEAWVSINREVTEEQYKLLLSIAEELDAEAMPYAPSLEIEKIE